MNPLTSLALDFRTVDWSSRPHVQNALAILERKPELATSSADLVAAPLIKLAGALEVWPLEAERANIFLASTFEPFKQKLFASIHSADVESATGAFFVLLRAHLPGGDAAFVLSQEEVGIIYSAARDRLFAPGNIGVSSKLTQACHCWLSLVELHGAVLPTNMQMIKSSQETADGRNQDATIGRRVLDGEGVLILGMSVGSSRFNASRTEQILDWLQTHRPDAQLMITDRPAIHNRLALGESEADAVKYCLKKGKQLRDYCTFVLNRPGNRMEVFNWDAIYQSSHFAEALAEFKLLAKVNTEFHSDVAQQSRRVLEREANGRTISDESVELAMNYLFEEFAAIEAIGRELSVPVAYAYYSQWLPYQKYVNGNYDGKVKELGFIKYDLPDESERPH